MLKDSKLIDIPIVIMIIGILLTNIFIKELFATDKFVTKSGVLSNTKDYSSDLEKKIRSGQTTTANEIIPVHPRVWLRGPEDWDKDKFGSYAWRIVHGPAMSIEFPAYAHTTFRCKSKKPYPKIHLDQNLQRSQCLSLVEDQTWLL